ncbi:MAG TPA: hypothetical protein V6C64_12690 [Microcoleaceae cyanobacterium]
MPTVLQDIAITDWRFSRLFSLHQLMPVQLQARYLDDAIEGYAERHGHPQRIHKVEFFNLKTQQWQQMPPADVNDAIDRWREQQHA